MGLTGLFDNLLVYFICEGVILKFCFGVRQEKGEWHGIFFFNLKIKFRISDKKTEF